jgi:RNA polymerase sigma-70 factor, ECF subfamily
MTGARSGALLHRLSPSREPAWDAELCAWGRLIRDGHVAVECSVADRKRQYLLLADEDLISLLVEGDARAFATLYDRHGRAAYSLAYRMMGEKQAAEDLVQDALLKVWRGAESYRTERGSVRTWILSIVHNRGIDQLRSLASRRRTQDRVEASAPTSQPSEAFAETWRNSQREQVREALSTLPPEQVKILELAYFSGYTHVEIAELLDLPLGTVKGRMRLGLRKIRDYFDLQDMAVPR